MSYQQRIFHIPQFYWLLNGFSLAHPWPSRLAFRISQLWLFGAKDGKDTFCLRWQIWFQWLPRRQQISWKLCVGALMSIKVIREKCPSQAELLKTKSWQAFSLPWVNGRVLLKIVDLLHSPKRDIKDWKQNWSAQLVEGKKSFILFWILGIFAPGDDGKHLDSEETLTGEPASCLARLKKRACKNAIVFRLHGWFAHARAFLLNKKMAGPNT